MKRGQPARDALDRAVTILGKTAAVEDRRRASSPKRRAEAQQRLRDLLLTGPPILPELEHWKDDTPLGIYKRAVREHEAALRQWRKGRDDAQAAQLYYRYRVGRITYGSFYAIGEGDTWNETLEAARRAVEDAAPTGNTE